MATCPDHDGYCSDCDFWIDDWTQKDLGAPLESLHVRVFAGCSGDTHSIYSMVIWVR